MEKNILDELIKKNITVSDIARQLNCSRNNVVYWIKKFKITTEKSDTKCCPKCKATKLLTEFYNRRGKEGSSCYCKLCCVGQTTIRHRNFKQKAVDYKGGQCIECGYNKYIGALDFHHLDPTKKDFNLGGFKSKILSDVIKKELDKCVLLCANCHREVHGNIKKLLVVDLVS